MKKLALVLAISIGTYGMTVASPLNQNMAIQQTQDDQKVEVTVDELPDVVVKTLSESEYQSWELGKVYQVTKSEDNSVYYLFDLKQGDEKKELKIDTEGNIMKDDESEES